MADNDEDRPQDITCSGGITLPPPGAAAPQEEDEPNG